MQIDDMPSCNEMDRLISEKVMGWMDFSDKSVAEPAGGWRLYRNGVLWQPSINIAHAWEVFEHLSKTYDISLSVDRGCAYQVYLHSGIDRDDDPNTYAPTAPLAICRAALKAHATR